MSEIDSTADLLELFLSFKELVNYHQLYIKSSNYASSIASEYVNKILEFKFVSFDPELSEVTP